MKPTAESLRRDRERRQRERLALADEYVNAADVLDNHPLRARFRNATAHLRREAESWKTTTETRQP